MFTPPKSLAKAPIGFHFAWAAVAICTFAAGYLAGPATVSSDGAKSVAGGSSAVSANRTPGSPQPSSGGSGETSATAVKTLSPEQARERGFRVVTDQVSRVVRMRQLCELMESISPENWRQALDGFETALRSLGSDGGEAYSLLLEQIGAIGGADAMDDALTPEKSSIRGRAITILKGWANADPRACVAWFEKQSPEIQDEYAGQMVAGISRVDPKTALEITFRPDKSYAIVGTVNAVINNSVSVVGVKGVEDIFVAMRGRQDLPAKAKQVFFAKLAGTKLSASQKAGETATQVLQSFDLHLGQDYLSVPDCTRIVSHAAKTNPEETLSWLDMQRERLTAEQAKAGYSGLARELQKQTPQKLTEWLAAYPEHPQRDNVMEAATGTLLSAGDYDGAARMAAAIGNEAVRAKVTGLVTQQAQKQGSKR